MRFAPFARVLFSRLRSLAACLGLLLDGGVLIVLAGI
jgi:hypothetical protein